MSDELRKVIDDAIAGAKPLPNGLDVANDIDIGLSHDMLGRVIIFFAAPQQWVSIGTPVDARRFAKAIIRRADRAERDARLSKQS